MAVLPACKQDEEVPPEHPPVEVHTVDLRLKFVFKYGTHDYELASEYTDVTGRLYRFDHIKFLLSDLDVINDEGDVLAQYPGVNLLVSAAGPEAIGFYERSELNVR